MSQIDDEYHQHKMPLVLRLAYHLPSHTHHYHHKRNPQLTVGLAASAQVGPTTTMNQSPLLFEISFSWWPLGPWQVGSRRTFFQRSPMNQAATAAWWWWWCWWEPWYSSAAAVDPVENPQLPSSVRRSFCMHRSVDYTLRLKDCTHTLEARRMAIQKARSPPVRRIV